jgi:hypothetical protein
MIIYNPFNLYLNNISAHKNASDYPDTRAKRKERKKERKKERRRGNQQRQKVFSAGKSDMSSSSEAEANPKENAREKRMQDFLGDDDDESTWSPPAKVKKAQEKRKKEEKTQRTSPYPCRTRCLLLVECHLPQVVEVDQVLKVIQGSLGRIAEAIFHLLELRSLLRGKLYLKVTENCHVIC